MPKADRRRPRSRALSRPSETARPLLDRILETPNLARVVPQLPPELLHRVIQHCGLEDSAELIALATPAQLAGVMDVDLWQAMRPGLDEELNPSRFGTWVEVLLECGTAVAAEKVSGIDPELMTAALAHHIRVFDVGTVDSYEMLDGTLIEGLRRSDRESAEIGGYYIEARRNDVWEPTLVLLAALDAEQPAYFHRLMRACRSVSNSAPELDGLDDLLTARAQDLFDLSTEREQRRAGQGFVTPAQARGFLEAARLVNLSAPAPPPPDANARAYFREMASLERSLPEVDSAGAAQDEASGPTPPSRDEAASAFATVSEILQEAGVTAAPSRALLGSGDPGAREQTRLHAQLQAVFEHDRVVHARRSAELAYLANTLMAGCSIQTRPFTPAEASDAVHAICNLALENWPKPWLSLENLEGVPDNFLVGHDLVSVFQIGWAILYRDVCMYASERLIAVLDSFRCTDPHLQLALIQLQLGLTKAWKAGTPWSIREDLDVIIRLDAMAWAAILGMIDEFPVMHAALDSTRAARLRTVTTSDVQYISDNRQIALIHTYLASLFDTLTK